MRRAKEIKEDVLAALDEVGDVPFAAMGFKRSKRSFSYVRNIRDAKQTIAIGVACRPNYHPGAELYFHPAMQIAMKPVTESALRLVRGNTMLLANAPDIIVNQPIEFTAPKAEYVRWFASGFKQIEQRVAEIGEFAQRWVSPLLDQLTTPDELIGVYETADDRLSKQRHWYLYIAAAHLVNGDTDKALTVLERNLGSPGLRKHFSVAFDSLKQSQ